MHSITFVPAELHLWWWQASDALQFGGDNRQQEGYLGQDAEPVSGPDYASTHTQLTLGLTAGPDRDSPDRASSSPGEEPRNGCASCCKSLLSLLRTGASLVDHECLHNWPVCPFKGAV